MLGVYKRYNPEFERAWKRFIREQKLKEAK